MEVKDQIMVKMAEMRRNEGFRPETIVINPETKLILDATTGRIRNRQRRKRIIREFRKNLPAQIRDARREKTQNVGLDRFITLGGE